MLQYMVAGLVLGGIYAIAATGLVVTYQSAGILNFSFGAIAYTVARFYYFLNTQHSWSILPAALLSILGLGPVLGLVLYFGLFRLMRLSSTLIKVLATIGISVGLPPTDTVIFGNQQILSAPGLAPQPVRVFHVIGVPVTLDQVIVYCCVLAILLVGFFVLRYTDVGLQIRALVDSPAMTSLSGTNPGRMSAAVWAVSCTLAGLSGVLVAPIIGLDPGDITLIMVAAFAAVVAARLRSLPIAAGVGLGMGIVSAMFQFWLPSASIYTADLLSAVPFLVIAGSLIFFIVRSGSIDEAQGVGGQLDRVIRPHGNESVQTGGNAGGGMLSWRPSAFAFACLLALPLFLHSFWLGLVGQGVAYGVIFLSFSLVVGEGGMIWLCQATFAGAGGMAAALLSAHQGVPVLLAVLIGGLIAVPFGVLIGWLTIRMGDLYVAIATLTFGLLIEDVVFNREIFFNEGIGTATYPPKFAVGSASTRVPGDRHLRRHRPPDRQPAPVDHRLGHDRHPVERDRFEDFRHQRGPDEGPDGRLCGVRGRDRRRDARDHHRRGPTHQLLHPGRGSLAGGVGDQRHPIECRLHRRRAQSDPGRGACARLPPAGLRQLHRRRCSAWAPSPSSSSPKAYSRHKFA